MIYLRYTHRDLAVLRTKVVVNTHTEDGSSLEVHRINYLLSMGACIVSERSLTDPELDAYYDDALVFVNNTRTRRRKQVKMAPRRGNIHPTPVNMKQSDPGTGISTEFTDDENDRFHADAEDREAPGAFNPHELDFEADDEEFQDIIDAAFQLARDPVTRASIQERAQKKYEEISRNISALRNAMQTTLTGLRGQISRSLKNL